MEIQPNSYLGRHLEAAQGDGEEKKYAFPDRPIIDGLSIDYSLQKNLIYKNGDSTIELSFSEYPYSLAMGKISKLQQARQNTDSKPEKDRIDKLIKLYNPPAYVIDEYKIRKGNNTLDFHELKSNIPDVKIIFNPKEKTDAFINLKTDEILVSGDITKVNTLLAILHEFGHRAIPDSENPAAQGRFFY